MFFRSWEAVLRVALSAATIYILVVLVLRIIGARALAKMSGYDLIVTIALGSLVAAVPLSTEITVIDGVTAILTFLVLQEITRFLQARYWAAHHIVRERPHLVVWDGNLIEERLKEIDTSVDEVRAAIRQAGLLSVHDAQAVVLENDGAWSVMRRDESKDLSALDGLDIPGHGPAEDGNRPQSPSKPQREQRPPSSSAASQL